MLEQEFPLWLTKREMRAILEDKMCSVCAGESPRRDGHDKNPPCLGAVLEKVQDLLSSPATDGERYRPLVEKGSESRLREVLGEPEGRSWVGCSGDLLVFPCEPPHPGG